MRTSIVASHLPNILFAGWVNSNETLPRYQMSLIEAAASRIDWQDWHDVNYCCWIWMRALRTPTDCLTIFPLRVWNQSLHPGLCDVKELFDAVGLFEITAARSPRRVASRDGENRDWMLPQDHVVSSMNPTRIRMRSYRPPETRTYASRAHEALAVSCPEGTIYPFGYFIPESMVYPSPPRLRLWDWSSVISRLKPQVAGGTGKVQGDFSSGEEELLYTLLTRYSYFNWAVEGDGILNSQRTMEILASGSLPYYPGFDQCDTCLSQLPNALLRETLRLDGVQEVLLPVGQQKEDKLVENKYVFYHHGRLHVKRPGAINHTHFFPDQYERLSSACHEYTRRHLTCGAGMASLLKRIQYEEPHNVLVLTQLGDVSNGNNGVCGVAELGLNYSRNVLGLEHWEPTRDARFTWNVREYIKVRRSDPLERSYAHGYLYAHRHPPPPHPILTSIQDSAFASPEECKHVIHGGRFDLILFGGPAPSSDSIPCYSEILTSPYMRRFVVIDDSVNQHFKHYAQLLVDGVKLFVVNRLECDDTTAA